MQPRIVSSDFMVCVFLLNISFQKGVLHFGDFYPIYLCHLETSLMMNVHILPVYFESLQSPTSFSVETLAAFDLNLFYTFLHPLFVSSRIVQIMNTESSSGA